MHSIYFFIFADFSSKPRSCSRNVQAPSSDTVLLEHVSAPSALDGFGLLWQLKREVSEISQSSPGSEQPPIDASRHRFFTTFNHSTTFLRAMHYFCGKTRPPSITLSERAILGIVDGWLSNHIRGRPLYVPLFNPSSIFRLARKYFDEAAQDDVFCALRDVDGWLNSSAEDQLETDAMRDGVCVSSKKVPSLDGVRSLRSKGDLGGTSTHGSRGNAFLGILAEHPSQTFSNISSRNSESLLQRDISISSNGYGSQSGSRDERGGEAVQTGDDPERDKHRSTLQRSSGPFSTQLLELGCGGLPQSDATSPAIQTCPGSKGPELFRESETSDGDMQPARETSSSGSSRPDRLQGALESLDRRSTSSSRDMEELLGTRAEDLLKGKNSPTNWLPSDTRTERSSGWCHQTREIYRGSGDHPTTFGKEVGDSGMEGGRRGCFFPSGDLHSHSSVGSILSHGLPSRGSQPHVDTLHVDRGPTRGIYKGGGVSKLESGLLSPSHDSKGVQRGFIDGSKNGDGLSSRNSQVWSSRMHPYPPKLPSKNGHHQETSSTSSENGFGKNQETSPNHSLRPHSQDIQFGGLHEKRVFWRSDATLCGRVEDASKTKETSWWLRIRDLPKHVQKIVNSVQNIENVFELEGAIKSFTVKKFASNVQNIERDKILETIRNACMTQNDFLGILYES